MIEYLDSRAERKFKNFFDQRSVFGQSQVSKALQLVGKEIERAFDALIVRGYGVAAHDEDLFQSASSFQFNDPRLNLSQIAELAGSPLGDGQVDRFVAVQRLFDDRC